MMKRKVDLLYEELSYKVRGAMIEIHKALGSGHKELVYHRALAEEFRKQKMNFCEEKSINVFYQDKKVGTYKPDFIVEDKIIVEIKAVPFMPRNFEEQLVHYLKSTKYKLGFLVNFGVRRLVIKRRIYTND